MTIAVLLAAYHWDYFYMAHQGSLEQKLTNKNDTNHTL